MRKQRTQTYNSIIKEIKQSNRIKMAEPDSDAKNTMEDEDLEDGEIETDEENDVVVNEVKPKANEPLRKPKSGDDDSSMKSIEAKVKNEHRRTSQENNAKSKKLTVNDVPKGKKFWFRVSAHYQQFLRFFSLFECKF